MTKEQVLKALKEEKPFASAYHGKVHDKTFKYFKASIKNNRVHVFFMLSHDDYDPDIFPEEIESCRLIDFLAYWNYP